MFWTWKTNLKKRGYTVNIIFKLAIIILACSITSTNAMDKAKLNEELVTQAGMGCLKKVRELIEQGADIEAKSAKDGITPLIAALQGSWQMQWGLGHISEDYVHIIKYLIERGANVNYQPENVGPVSGMTPLMYAAINSPEIFKAILDKNPDVTLLNEKGTTVLDMLCEAASPENESEASTFKIQEKLTILLTHLVTIEARNRSQIESEARPMLVSATNNQLTDLIFDYMGTAPYPLSDKAPISLTQRIKTQDTVRFVNPDGAK